MYANVRELFANFVGRMRIIEKKIWPKFFEAVKARHKRVEIRLADFKIAEGDTLVLREWDPKANRYTGRSLRRKVGRVHRVDMTRFHSLTELKKHGLYAIELR